MTRKIVSIGFLGVALLSPATPVSARLGSETPPVEVVGPVREVDRVQNRIVMQDRGLEVWATDSHQLDGLVEGHNVRLRFEQRSGKRTIYRIEPITR